MVSPNICTNGNTLTDTGYRSTDVEITTCCMIPFVNSPGDLRAWITEAITRSILGYHIYKIDQLPGRRLMTSQSNAVNRRTKITEEQFKIHRIKERTYECGG